jgi:hypothetical protein
MNQMYKHPLDYKKEDIQELMFKPLRIFVGSAKNDSVSEILEGHIERCGLASNPPHLPADIEFQLENGQIRKFNFFELKKFEGR